MEFCMRLVTKVIMQEIRQNKKNVVMSPSSLNLLLNMVASGSAGKTLEQFHRFLVSETISDLNSESSSLMALIGSSSTAAVNTTWERKASTNNDMMMREEQKQQPVLSLVNLLLVDQNHQLKPSFQKIIRDVYKTEPESVDYAEQEQLRSKVNSWAEENTKGLIKEILQSTQKVQGPLFLANALHFKAAWAREFEPSMTRDEDFHLLDGKTIRVPFMIAKRRRCSYYESPNNFKAIRLHYLGDSVGEMRRDFYMDIILPHRKDGLQDMIDSFESEPELLLGDFEFETRTISDMFIPKWKFSYDSEPVDVLKTMGLTLPFEYLAADFTEMIVDSSLAKKLYVKKILHKACISVDEEGTEGAAVSCVPFAGCSPYEPPKANFVADHPFMFVVKEGQSGAVIFAGAVLTPLSHDT